MDDLERICEKILNIDQKIRFVEIAINDKIFRKLRPGLKSNLTPEEIESSIDDSLARWTTRNKLSNKIGMPLYALAEYEKVKRITVPVIDGGIMLVTLDSTASHDGIIKKIIEIKEMIN